MARKQERRGRGIAVKSPRMQERFLTLIANGHTIKSACEDLDIARSTIFKWRREEESFDAAYLTAQEEWQDTIRAEIYRRGVRGVRRTKLQGGRLIIEREYSDRMLELLAKGNLPEYRSTDQPQINIHNQTNVMSLTEEQLKDRLQKRGIPLLEIDQ